mmetsp:Transcript_28325/g.39132  ORF Transcript_28325/g.39132 Transcript_28325/m.39132 type:complete len:207 (-) Transcript_28325:128-748(-)|eukprot:CAMPEP_0196579892 /NCGR_PEP_ID=MMETSP1081-20130531/25556_1 /TAXON_ID=36882 /ORGANISM="Pyramimonas amylifera, Strain CCMP720" /LENGTH=206 /DNA_ID=CAMNT_0041899607 /DNA_START=100 /DNA_END=720 /DNA_ORIENTATION=-
MCSWLPSIWIFGKKEKEQDHEDDSVKKSQPINLGDSAAVKHALDACAVEVVTSNYPEDYTHSNHNIAFGLLACALAAVAQFYPKNGAHVFYVQLGCVLGYMTISTLLTMYMATYGKDFIVSTYAKPASPSDTGITVVGELPRFSHLYKLTIASKETKSIAARQSVTIEKSITEWFYEDGNLAEDIFRKEVEDLLKKYENSDSIKSQ